VNPLRLAILASGQGTNLQNIHQQIAAGNLPGVEIALVVSNNSGSGAMEYAHQRSFPTAHVSATKQGSQEAADAALLQHLIEHRIDIIVLAGYMKKVPQAVIREYAGRIINVHPALLPAYGGEGMYGMRVHEAVLQRGERFSGATAHLVTEHYDEGPIILQESCEVAPSDTPESLSEKVRKIEFRLLPRAIALLSEKLRRNS
jgi:formyltetrahydrofolate-dependent phosphoribosylglycinamide formyltransferase